MQLSILKANETALRDCGQKALAQVARLQGDSETATTLTNLPAAGPHGFTAAELHSLALANGISSFPVEAPLALDALPVPFIAHYNDRHYVTVEAVSKDTVKLYDSRISTTTEMPRGSFERAWSGFALLVKEPPHNESIHVAQNLDQIVGGCCGLDRLVSNLGKDHCDKSCNAPANSVDDSRGLPSYSVNPINMNFKVIDTPMWWDAPVGPAVSMTLLFNSQDSQNNYTPFGGKWAFEYASYLLITPSNNSHGGGCQVRDGDGRMESFTLPATGSGYPKTYGPPPGDFRTLVETTLYQFDLTQQDGTVYHYGIPAAAAGNSNVPLLLSITDRHNNSIAITHNANGAITKIEHSALPGKSWDFTYTTIGTLSRCTAILDPFSRTAHFAYDTAGHLTSQIDMGGLAYSYTYTSTGPLFINSITTPSGTSTVYTEPADRIYNSTNHYPDPGGVMWQNYRITINDHLGFPTEYYYSGFYRRGYMRNPIQMQRTPGNLDPENGSRTEFGFELVGGKGQITSTVVLDENGHAVFQSQNTGYDNTTRLASYISDGNGGQDYLEYNLKGKPTLIDPHGNTGDEELLITYQSNGIDIDTVTRTLQGVSKTLVDYNYFSNRDVQSVTDVNGRTISYLWYSNRLLQQITDSVTGDVVAFTYDTHLRPSTTSINSVVVSTTVYDTDGKGVLLATLAPNGQYASYEYDDLNRLTRELHSDDSFTAYQWACCYIEATRYGKIVGGSEKTLKRSVTHHDARVLPLSTTNTDGLTTRYSYDIAGRLTGLTDSKDQTTQWQLNGPGQLMKKIYPDASEENYTYDNSGHLESYVNRRSQVTWINYDNDGQAHDIQAYDNLSYSSMAFTYDSWRRLSNLEFHTNQSGNWATETHTFTRDLLGRVTSMDGPWADDTIGYAYNDAARTVTRTSPGGMTQTSTTDAYGRIDSIANVLGTFTNTYDGVGGPLTQITHTGANAGFDTAFTYLGDDFNRALATITSYKPGAAAVSKHTYTYDPLGNIATWKRETPLANPSGPTQQFQSTAYYDQGDQLTSLINQPISGSASVTNGFHYKYDSAGNLASKQVENSASDTTISTYNHNTLNHISSSGGTDGVKPITVRGSTNESATVMLKPNLANHWKDARILSGNRFEAEIGLTAGSNQIHIQAKDGSNNVSSYTYTLNLTTPPAASPTYDADGNMTSDGVRSYEWDIQSRLMKIIWGASSNQTTSYRYNALGQRSEQIEMTGTTETAHYYYLYNGIQRITRFNGGTATENLDRQYLAQGEQRITTANYQTSTLTYYYNRDHLGSIREVMNSDGTLAARYDYDPYGKRSTQYQSSTYSDGCDLAYTGHYIQPSPVAGQSELELTFYRAYDPELGRWLSVDPLGEAGGMNLYGYVGGNPVNFYDPDGREPQRVPGTNFDRHVVGTRAAPVNANLAVRYPGKGYDNQCAAGAQYLSGGNGRDAPNASSWERGSAVGPNTPPGTMIARGWVPNSNKSSGYGYPNQSNVGQSGVSNHTVIFLGMHESGDIMVRHQYRESSGKGCPMHESREPASNFHEVWTKPGAATDRSSGSWGVPYGQ